MKGVFGRFPTDESNMHLESFIWICSSHINLGVKLNTLRLMLFPFSLPRETSLWLGDILIEFINSWNKLRRKFLNRFFPPTMMLNLKDVTYNFR